MSSGQIILDERPHRNQSAEKIWAFIAIDKEGNESPCGMSTAMGFMMMSSKWTEVERMRPLATNMARSTGLRIVLRVYSQSTDLEEL